MATADGGNRGGGSGQSWSVSSIIYDPKIRGAIFQTLLVLSVLLFVWWIVDNTIANLAAKNKRTGFDFLFEASDFAILTTPGTYIMNYTPGFSTNFDLFLVGLINTIAVSALGIVAATVIGFTFGVFRLSSNFVLRAFGTLYVELFRNIPLLLQMLLWFKLVSEFLPNPGGDALQLGGGVYADKSGFRGSFPDLLPGGGMFWIVFFALLFSWWGLKRFARIRKDRTGKGFPTVWVGLGLLVAVGGAGYWVAGYQTAQSAAGFYESDFIAKRFVTEDPRHRRIEVPVTVPDSDALSSAAKTVNSPLKVTAILECAPAVEGGKPVYVAKVDGLNEINDIILGRYHGDRKPLRGYDVASANCVEPAWMAPVQWEEPTLRGLGNSLRWEKGFGLIFPLEMFAVWLALTLYTGSFIAEIVRSGVLAVSKGQSEAAGALGLRPTQTLFLVVIPQAMRVIIPPLTSQFLNLTKNSSLATVVAYTDLVQVFAGTGLNKIGQEIEVLFITMMVYLTLSLLISAFMNWYNKRIALVER